MFGHQTNNLLISIKYRYVSNNSINHADLSLFFFFFYWKSYWITTLKLKVKSNHSFWKLWHHYELLSTISRSSTLWVDGSVQATTNTTIHNMFDQSNIFLRNHSTLPFDHLGEGIFCGCQLLWPYVVKSVAQWCLQPRIALWCLLQLVYYLLWPKPPT